MLLLIAICAFAAGGLQLVSRDIAFTHANSPTSRKYLPETMGGGVALLDFDNDGRLDIFFVNGAKIADPMSPGRTPDKSEPKYWIRLYHQNADGTFTDVTERAGLTGRVDVRHGNALDTLPQLCLLYTTDAADD